MLKLLIIISLIILTESLSDKTTNLYTNNVVELTGVPKKDDEVFNTAVESLRKGNIIALPTDTTYAFAVGINNTNAIRKLYTITGTPYNHSLSICIGRVTEVGIWGMVDDVRSSLIDELLPGPITILLERKPSVNPKLNPHSNLVGIRIPGAKSLPFISKVVNTYGDPLVLMPARYYNNSQSLSVYHFQKLWQKADIVYDIGELPTSGFHGSTVVDLSINGEYRVIREGLHTRADAVRSIAERFELKDPTTKTPLRSLFDISEY